MKFVTNKLTLGKKFAFGFGTLITMIVALAVIVSVQLFGVNSQIDHVLHKDVKSVENAIEMQSSIHHSLSMHRGYMILGQPALAEERLKAWESIDEHAAKLDKLSGYWKEPATIEAMATLKQVLGEFRTAQDKVVSVAHTDEDNLAYTEFFTDVMPLAKAMEKSLNKIIKLEHDLAATAERKHLIEYVAEAKSHLLHFEISITAFLINGTEEERQAIDHDIASCQASVDKLKSMANLFNEDQTKAFGQYVSDRDQFLAKATEVIDLRSSDDWCKSEYVCLNSVTPLSARADKLLDQIIEQQGAKQVAGDKALTAAGKQLQVITVVTAIAALILGCIIAYVLSHQITRSLNRVVERARQIANKDLSGEKLETKSSDEIGNLARAINDMQSALNEVIAEVTGASSEVAAASTEIAASAEEIAAGASEQSHQITQVSSAVEEMSASVVEVARKSADAANSANESGRLATEGGDVVEQTITGMASINEAVSSSAASVQELGKRGEQIGEVITVINDIADQTNLLALNAAIEAARAGEHGRGFAVVADEVRKLADRTTKATEEIAGSIQAIQTETTIAVDKMNAGTEEVATGVEKAESAGDSLKQIVASAQDVSAMVQSIAAAAEEQSAASEEVSRNIEQIAAVTRQTSEGTNQAAAAATQLSQRAETLQNLVGQFKTDRG